MPEPLVVVHDLHKTFLHMGNELQVLKGIDLRIDEGEIVSIVGKSGAGKSTLLHCIGTLDQPTSGVVSIGDHDLVGMSDRELAGVRNRMIGFVFQFHHLLPEFNALENVMMPGLIQGMNRAELQTRATNLLTEVGLGERTTHRPGELSGGEQQRVALARALILEPKLILADEPTGNLDTGTSDDIHNLFFSINEKHGTTIVVVTHNNKLADQMPRKITMMDGKVADDSKPPASIPEVDARLLDRSRALATVKPASFRRRAAARFIDLAAQNLAAAGLGLGAVLAPPLAAHAPVLLERTRTFLGFAFLVVIAGVVDVLARALAEAFGGATLGKVVVGLRVKNETLDPISLIPALARNTAIIVDGILFGLVGYMAMSGSLMKQRIGDRLAGTFVVEAKTLPADELGVGWLGIALGIAAYAVLLAGGWMLLLWF